MEDLSPPDYNGPPSHGRASPQSRCRFSLGCHIPV